MSRLRLSLACGSYDRTEALLDGTVKPEGIDLFCTRSPIPETTWRMFNYSDFDVSEMSMSFYLIAKFRSKAPFVAIPVFPMRKFFHVDLLCNVASGIEDPSDLVGKRVGLQEYAMTMGLWIRGIFQHEYKVRPDQIKWYVERTGTLSTAEAVGFKAPRSISITKVPPDDNLNSMLLDGRIDVYRPYPWKNIADRKSGFTVRVEEDPRVKPLFQDSKETAIQYFRKTKIFPINHTIVVNKKVLKENPWVAVNLFKAFQESKDICYRRLEQMSKEPNSMVWSSQLLKEVRQIFGGDPFQYGFKVNRRIIETITRYSFEQGLTPRKVEPEELFADNTLDL